MAGAAAVASTLASEKRKENEGEPPGELKAGDFRALINQKAPLLVHCIVFNDKSALPFDVCCLLY